ncbi:hypothetical protein ACTA71_008272 [Dictyostelium dimigraforme]
MGFSEVKTKSIFKFDFLDNLFNKEKKEFIKEWTKKIKEAFLVFIKKLKLSSKWVEENIVKPILLKLTELWQCSYVMIQSSTVSRHEYFELQQEFNKEAENLLKRFEEKLDQKQQQQQQRQQQQKQQPEQQQDLKQCQDESRPENNYYQEEQSYTQELQQQSNKKFD